MKKNNKIVNKIDEAILKESQDDVSFWDSYLTDNGYNLSDVNVIVEKNFKKHSFLIKGLINREKDKIRLEKQQ
jgi:aminopeptidase N